MRGNYGRAVQSRGQCVTPSRASCDLETISLVCYRWQHHYVIDADSCDEIFGWDFDGLQITAQRYHCEVLESLGRVEEAAEVLLNILETFGESKAIPEWVTGGCRHSNRVDVDNLFSQISRKDVLTCSKHWATRHSTLESSMRRLHGTPLHCLSILR